MASINGTIVGGTPPYQILVRKVGETTDRCTGDCTDFPVTFTTDSGENTYYAIVIDSENCTKDSRDYGPNIGKLNCDPVCNLLPWFGTVTCDDLVGNLPVTFENGVAPYSIKVYYIPPVGETETLDRFISLENNIIKFNRVNTSAPSNYIVHITDGNGCFLDPTFQSTCNTTPISVDFEASLVQPYCSSSTGGSIINASLILSNIVGGTRYKVCYNSSTFSPTCISGCSSSDGTIVNDSKTIEVISPSEGTSQTNTIRVFNGAGCNTYKDYTFSVYSPRCSTTQITMASIDITTGDTSAGPCTTTAGNRNVDFDMYLTLNTAGVSESGQKSLHKASLERNVPNGNDVPNVFISASLELNCGPGPFYRWFINISLLRARYPNINLFTFDMYIKRSKGIINSRMEFSINSQKNVALVKVPTPQLTNCDGTPSPPSNRNNTDVGRLPCYSGTAQVVDYIYYGEQDVGYRKMGTITYNVTTDTMTGTV